MSSASLSTNCFPGVRLCSERDCDNVISFPPFKGDFCTRCTARMRSRRSSSVRYAPFASSERPPFLGVSTPLSNGNVPSSVAAHLLQRGPILPPPPLPPLLPSQITRSNVLAVHVGQHYRGPVSIYPSEQHSISRLPTSVMSNRSVPYTFPGHGGPLDAPGLLFHEETIRNSLTASEVQINSLPKQEEADPPQRKNRCCTRCGATMPQYYIGDACPGCRVEVAMLVDGAHSAGAEQSAVVTKEITAIDISKDVMSMFSNSNDNDDFDVDMDDIELSYPAAAETIPHLPPAHGNTQEATYIPAYAVSSAAPLKRQKVSHLTVVDLTISPPPSPPANDHFKPPEISKPIRTTSGSLKLCSETNCTGIISIDSSAIRCLDCIRRHWIFKKTTRFSDSKPEASPNAQKTVSILRQGEVEQKSKKAGVTWADQVAQPILSKEFPPQEAAIVTHGNITNLIPVKDDAGTISPVVLEDCTDLEGHTEISDITESGCMKTPRPASPDGTEECRRVPFVNKCASPLMRLSSLSIQGSGSDMVDGVAGTWVEQPTIQNSSCKVTGWDSDLTELNDSEDEAESRDGSSEPEMNDDAPPTAPSGLKIRIPARPAGAYSRKCASPKCHQLLSVGYRWKSCVLCRARSRDYQRRRQNLQGKHLRLDEELLDAENAGTPLAGDLITRTSKSIEASIGLVPGARLCSIRNCTYIIPPTDEYHWKMCGVCRLRRREMRRQSLARSNQPTKTMDSAIPKSLAKLRKRDPTPGSRRCRSLDCGMLVVDSMSVDCKQCIARMIWLVSRNSVSIPPIERPRVPPPYPQYKCFPALLLQFKNRLSGFLQAQSVFFLFKQPDSAKAMFAFDGEFSVVVPDFDIVDRKEEVDANALKLKREIEHVGRIRFSPKRLVSILDGGGISIRFCSMYAVPILQAKKDQTTIAKFAKSMQCELEIASLPDYSHRFIPGQRTIVRFRLLG